MIKLIDRYSLAIALTVQLGMVSVSMIALAPNVLTAAGYTGLGVAAVLFAPRSFQKYLDTHRPRYIINYALFAAFTVFIGISFALAGTSAQADTVGVNITLSNDEALAQYESDLESAIALREQLKDEYDQTRGADLLDNIQRRQIANDDEIIRLQRKIEDRRDFILSGEATEKARESLQQVSSDSVFTAIAAALPGRWIQLIFWAVLMVGAELMIINSLQEKREAPAPQQAQTIEPKSDPILPYKPKLTRGDVKTFITQEWPKQIPGTWRTPAELEASGWTREQQRELFKVLLQIGVIEKQYNGGLSAAKNRKEALEILKNTKVGGAK
jgi:hypothetical protein